MTQAPTTNQHALSAPRVIGQLARAAVCRLTANCRRQSVFVPQTPRDFSRPETYRAGGGIHTRQSSYGRQSGPLPVCDIIDFRSTDWIWSDFPRCLPTAPGGDGGAAELCVYGLITSD